MAYISDKNRYGLTIPAVGLRLSERFEVSEDKKRWIADPRNLWSHYAYFMNQSYIDPYYSNRLVENTYHNITFGTITGFVFLAKLSADYKDFITFLKQSKKESEMPPEKAIKRYLNEMPPLYKNFKDRISNIYYLDHLSVVIEILNIQGETRLKNWYKEKGKYIARNESRDEFVDAIIELILEIITKFNNRRYRNYEEAYQTIIKDVTDLSDAALHYVGYIDATVLPTMGNLKRLREVADRFHKLADRLIRYADAAEERKRKAEEKQHKTP